MTKKLPLPSTVTGPKGTVRIKWNAEWEEYTCKLVGTKDDGYHTSDRQDAIDTAYAMAGSTNPSATF